MIGELFTSFASMADLPNELSLAASGSTKDEGEPTFEKVYYRMALAMLVVLIVAPGSLEMLPVTTRTSLMRYAAESVFCNALFEYDTGGIGGTPA